MFICLFGEHLTYIDRVLNYGIRKEKLPNSAMIANLLVFICIVSTYFLTIGISIFLSILTILFWSLFWKEIKSKECLEAIGPNLALMILLIALLSI